MNDTTNTSSPHYKNTNPTKTPPHHKNIQKPPQPTQQQHHHLTKKTTLRHTTTTNKQQNKKTTNNEKQGSRLIQHPCAHAHVFLLIQKPQSTNVVFWKKNKLIFGLSIFRRKAMNEPWKGKKIELEISCGVYFMYDSWIMCVSANIFNVLRVRLVIGYTLMGYIWWNAIIFFEESCWQQEFHVCTSRFMSYLRFRWSTESSSVTPQLSHEQCKMQIITRLNQRQFCKSSTGQLFRFIDLDFKRYF